LRAVRICKKTCPERAIALTPRLDLTRTARTPRVLTRRRSSPCVKCGKPLGTEQMIGAMLARLAGHSMFAAPGALDRLKMCADCRVVDLWQSGQHPTSGTSEREPSVASAPIALRHRLAPEDRARADFYAILAALFADAPDAKLLATVGATDLLEAAEAGELPLAWNRLVAACRVMDAEAARQEHTDLFVGTGRTEVNLHGSHWRSGS